MMTLRVKEEDEDGIVLADSVVENVVIGSVLIVFGLCCSWKLFFLIFDGGIFIGLFGVLLFGVLPLFIGLYGVLVKETVIIDKRLQSAVIMKESPIKHFESTKKIPFSNLKIIEIIYNTQYESGDYDSPMNGPCESWDISLITIDDGSIKICRGDSKPEVEKITESICKITGKMLTHRTEYTPVYV